MASLTRGVSFRRQGSSGRSWADNLVLGEQQPQRYSCGRGGKSDGITKKSIMAPDDLSSSNAPQQLKVNRSNSPNGDRSKSNGSRNGGGGVFGWLKSRFKKTRS